MSIDLIERPTSPAAEFTPLMERAREPLADAMARHLVDRGAARPGQAAHVAGALFDILVDDAGRRDGGESAAHIGEIRRHLRWLGVRDEQFSAFGDGLAPVLRDVLGADATAELVAAWGDAYWRTVRRLQAAAVNPDRRSAPAVGAAFA